MIEAVFVFAVLTAIFECVLFCSMPLKTRLRVLGTPWKMQLVHFCFFSFNLAIHWGTIVGVMTAISAALASFVVGIALQRVFGQITDGRYYKVGLLKFDPEALR